MYKCYLLNIPFAYLDAMKAKRSNSAIDGMIFPA
jgi:hypothetical protein